MLQDIVKIQELLTLQMVRWLQQLTRFLISIGGAAYQGSFIHCIVHRLFVSHVEDFEGNRSSFYVHFLEEIAPLPEQQAVEAALRNLADALHAPRRNPRPPRAVFF